VADSDADCLEKVGCQVILRRAEHAQNNQINKHKRKPELKAPASGPLAWHWGWVGTSRPGGGQASKQRNFTFRFETRRLRDFFFGSRFHEFSSADGSCSPDLRKEIAIVISFENQLRLGWCFVCLGSIREHHGGRLCICAANQNHSGIPVQLLDAILTGRQCRIACRECKWNVHQHGFVCTHNLSRPCSRTPANLPSLKDAFSWEPPLSF